MPLKWNPAVLFPDNTEDYVWHLHSPGIMKGWIRKHEEKLGERRMIFSQLDRSNRNSAGKSRIGPQASLLFIANFM